MLENPEKPKICGAIRTMFAKAPKHRVELSGGTKTIENDDSGVRPQITFGSSGIMWA